MSTDLKDSIHRLSNHLQATLGFLELQNYDRAVEALHTAIVEAVALAGQIKGFVAVLPQDHVVVVPHGTIVISSEEVRPSELVRGATVYVIEASKLKEALLKPEAAS